jgi:N-acetylglucosamine-6-phosphate deacetylase
VHLEGPFLSREWPGAHDPAHLLDPDGVLADRLCDAGPVTMITLAPELVGALELVERLARRGVTVSVGHSDADAAAAHAAFDRGARAITHVHNAHRRWRARDPGPAGVALVRPDVWVQAIVDGVHLAPESALGAFLAAGRRFCLVTDAVEAAGMPPGSYRLADRVLHVEGGAVRLADGTLAGSVLTMDAAVRNLVDSGTGLADAVHAAATAPARLLGRDDLGALRPGMAANITVLNDNLAVERTIVSGHEAFAVS